MQIKVSGGSLNIVESGAKNNFPSLVFLHYFGGAGVSWHETIEILAKDFHCVAVDLRGFGESQDTPPNYKLENYAGDVLELVQVLELENYALVGHSMGGKIAFLVAAAQPEKLRGLILLAPSPPVPEPMADHERKRLRDTHGTENAAVETIKKSSFRELPADVFAEAVKANLESNEAAWQAWLDSESRRDITELLTKINVPVICAVGEKDKNITAEIVTREILSRVKQAQLTVIENAAHLLPLEAVNKVAGFVKLKALDFAL